MTESYEAPWYDDLSMPDKMAYRKSANELIADLRTAADFMNRNHNARAFPVRSYQPEVDLQYFVQDDDPDPRALFEALSKNVLDAGGSVFVREDVSGSGAQHIAELRFGSGRVAYRVVWIERTPQVQTANGEPCGDPTTAWNPRSDQ